MVVDCHLFNFSLPNLYCYCSIIFYFYDMLILFYLNDRWQVVILTGAGSGDSGVYRIDYVQVRGTKLTGDLQLALLNLSSNFGEDWN